MTTSSGQLVYVFLCSIFLVFGHITNSNFYILLFFSHLLLSLFAIQPSTYHITVTFWSSCLDPRFTHDLNSMLALFGYFLNSTDPPACPPAAPGCHPPTYRLLLLVLDQPNPPALPPVHVFRRNRFLISSPSFLRCSSIRWTTLSACVPTPQWPCT